MRLVHCFAIVSVSLAAVAAAAEEPAALERLAALEGHWRGVGEGRWGHSSAQLEFAWALDGHYLHGSGRAVYPRQENNPEGEVHDFVDYYSYDARRGSLVLREFDNEGYVTTYYLQPSSSGDTLVFEAEQLENVPEGWKARLTLLFRGPDEYHERFELDTTGEGYREYLLTRYLKVANRGSSRKPDDVR